MLKSELRLAGWVEGFVALRSWSEAKHRNEVYWKSNVWFRCLCRVPDLTSEWEMISLNELKEIHRAGWFRGQSVCCGPARPHRIMKT